MMTTRMNRNSLPGSPINPALTCRLCPRLFEYRGQNRTQYPDWFNGPVPVWGAHRPGLLIVGLAPGVKGANRTGRPFTGDFAGDLLFATLKKFGLATGTYDARPDDGVELVDCAIINAVRCVPPQNKPTPAEINTCRQFLVPALTGPHQPKIVLALGTIAHASILSALGVRKSAYKFAHGARHDLTDAPVLFDSYHCSRYNTNTRRLTAPMFEQVFAAATALL
jgi:uracil-DNA glycosylase